MPRNQMATNALSCEITMLLVTDEISQLRAVSVFADICKGGYRDA